MSGPTNLISWVWASTAAAACAVGCGGAQNLVPGAPTSANALVNASRPSCSADLTARPYLIQWPSAERAELEVRLRRGLAVVRYTGCSLELIQDCNGPAELQYQYVGITSKEDEVRIQDTSDLYANIPIGAVELEAKLRSGKELRVNSLIVGRYEGPVHPVSFASLEGSECAKATHTVRAVTVGAFRLTTGLRQSLSGSASGFLASAQGQATSREDTLSRDGDPSACIAENDADQALSLPPSGCGALLRVELSRVDQTAERPVTKQERVCPGGMRFVEFKGCQPLDVQQADNQGASAVASRFVFESGAVFDSTTGMTWQKEPAPNTMIWEAAKRYCLGLALDGTTGWRLARKQELASLIEKNRVGPKIDTRAFSSAPATSFWTISPDTTSPGDAWAVDFHLGRQESRGTGSMLYVRCVR